ncbi:MAG TPA: SAM-dependent methyltransferase [Mollicutes bacterium]|nr:SAM-dependent methyltransferase [Mollicutes bacterium]
MIKLSKRLSTIASFVRSDAKLVDIGCDHALLDLYLLQNNPKLKAIGVDVKEGALNQALNNVEKYNMKGKLDLRLGDGLEPVKKEEIDTVVISGLGSYKIVEILNNGLEKLTNVSDIVVQTNSDHYFLRKKVCLLGFYIAGETLVKENNIIYLVVHFKKGKKRYSRKDYILGPILRIEKSKLYKENIIKELKKKEILYDLIPRRYFLKRIMLKRQILKLKTSIKQKN